MNYADALVTIGGLAKPSKMPWWGWSISAVDCITGSKLAQGEGTVCSDCYALKGRYLFPNVKVAHDRRLAASHHPDFVDAFVIVLDNLYRRTRKRRDNGEVENRFRWFDSGDLQSVDLLEKINQIATRTPNLAHWLPTREVSIVDEFAKKGNSLAPNLTVRISAPLIGETFKKRPAGLPVATVGMPGSTGAHDCQALASQGNQCLDCDRCWSKGQDINYPLH